MRKLGFVCLFSALIALGLIVPTATQQPMLLFGSNSGTPVPISVTSGGVINATASGNPTFGTVTVTTAFVGPGTASATGDLRLKNTGWIAGRNAANSADVNLARINTSNQVELSGPVAIDNPVQNISGVNTTGSFGVSPIVAVTETTGNTAAVTNAINYTPAGVSRTYEMTGVVNVTAWTTPASFTVAATYKDASGNARTDTALVWRGSTGASAAAVTAVDRWYFHFPAIDIDASATAITVSTTGTFTGSPVYNFQAQLRVVR